MIIGIDGNEANIKKRVGVNVYAFEILWSLNRLLIKKGKAHKIIVYLKAPPRKDMPPAGKYLEYKILPGGRAWVLTSLTSYLFKTKNKPDVLFSPGHYSVLVSPIPRVVAIMDLGYLKFSGQFKKYDFWQLKLWTAISIFVSKYVISISNSTKRDIIKRYRFAKNKIIVVYPANNKKVFNTKISSKEVTRIRNKYSLDKYLLFLSTLKPSKNIEGLLDAFGIINKKYPNYKLVIAGKKGWLYGSVAQKVQKLRLEDKVVFTGFVPDDDVAGLIKGAKVFVSPSFWEGFGLVVLDALACGVAVVSSNAGSLPEVVGKAGLLVNPNNHEEIAKAVMEILSMSPKRYNTLVTKGLLQAEKFDWEKTATKTLEVLIKTHDKR